MIPSSLQRYGQTILPSSKHSHELRAYSTSEWKGEVVSLLHERKEAGTSGKAAQGAAVTRPRKVHARPGHHHIDDLRMMLKNAIHLHRRIPPHV